MSFKHIPGLNAPPTSDTPGRGAGPKIGQPQLQMLQACGINSLENLYRYMQHVERGESGEERDVSQPAQSGKFRVVTAEELGFDKDSEHRLYEENIAVRDSILNLSGLRIRNSETVEFTNCIIIGDLNVSMNNKTLRKIYLDRCLVLGDILIHNVESPDCTLEIGDSNYFELIVRSSAVKSIDISRCKIPALHLLSLSVGDLSIVGNQIAYARFCQVSVKAPRIDHEQIDLKRIAQKTPPQHDLHDLPEGFFEIIDRISFGDRDREELFQTLSFLRENTAIESDRRSLNTVRLIASSRFQRSFLGELAVRLLGAVQRPSQVLFVAVGVFFLMALAYSFLPLQFAQGQTTIQLDFPTACYFSGITMMTVGYGDIVPLGIARYLAIIESVLGITMWSVYVVALVRKYID